MFRDEIDSYDSFDLSRLQIRIWLARSERPQRHWVSVKLDLHHFRISTLDAFFSNSSADRDSVMRKFFYWDHCFENVSLHLVIVRNCWERCHRVDFSVLLWFNRCLNDILLLLCQRVNHNLVSRFSHDCSFSAPQSYFHVCASNRCFVCSAIIQSSDLIASDEKDFWCWNICCRLAVLFKAGSAAVLSATTTCFYSL